MDFFFTILILEVSLEAKPVQGWKEVEEGGIYITPFIRGVESFHMACVKRAPAFLAAGVRAPSPDEKHNNHGSSPLKRKSRPVTFEAHLPPERKGQILSYFQNKHIISVHPSYLPTLRYDLSPTQ